MNSFHETQVLFSPLHFLNQPFPSHSPKSPSLRNYSYHSHYTPKQVCLCFSLGVLRDHTPSSPWLPHTLLPSISSQQHSNTHIESPNKNSAFQNHFSSHITQSDEPSQYQQQTPVPAGEGFSLAPTVTVFSPPAPCSITPFSSPEALHWKLWKRGFWFMM